MRHSFLTLSIVCALVATSCKDDAPTTEAHITTTSSTETDNTSTTTTTISATTIEANRFVNDVMETYYYWNQEMPSLDYRTQTDTEKYFYSLLSSKDRFSYISNDAETTNNEFSGIYTAFGWEYVLSYYGTGSDVVAIITYVSDNSPASRAGVRRGDVIRSVDGTTITASNYSSVFVNATSGTFRGFHGSDAISYTMTRESITVNPVARTAVFDLSNGKRAGYLLYNSYSSAFNTDLESAFSALKAEGVSEMILDLRYNTGGSMDAVTVMASILVPEDAAKGKKEMLYYDYNNSNSQTFDTSSGHGMAPNFYAYDYSDLLTTGLKELGDPDETLTAAAIEFLETGTVAGSQNKALEQKPRQLGSSADSKLKILYQEKSVEM